jgi:hypothetical protein
MYERFKIHNNTGDYKLEIVGYLDDRDRLGHWWVSEMMLNAQSELLVGTNIIYEIKVIIALYKYTK